MSLRIARILALSLALMPLLAYPANKIAAPAVTAEAGDVMVNEQRVPAEEVRQFLADHLPPGGRSMPARENALREQLVARELFAQEARHVRMDKTPEIAARMRSASEDVLAQQYQSRYLALHPVSEAELTAAYATLKQRAGDTEYHVRQVFVLTEQEARDIIARLVAGEKFETQVALSKDEASRAKAGDLGFQTPLTIQPAIAETLAQLKKGEFTRVPQQSPNGWHVLLLEDSRPFTLAPLEKLQPQLRTELGRNKLMALLADLRKKATVR